MKQFLKKMLLVALLCVPWVTQAQTDTLTVADGTTTNSYIPIYGMYVDEAQHNQIIYPTSMLAELMGDSITGMGFYMSSLASGPWGTTVTISVGITSLDDLSSGLDAITSLTQVWQGVVNGQDDTMWCNFTEAIPYMGGNLLVDITTTAASWKSASFYGIASPAGSRCSYGSYSNNSENFIPKTSFLHVDGDFTVCLMPTNLNVVASPYSATLSWTAPEGVTDFAVTLNGQPVDNVSNPMTIDNLVPGTNYSVSVSSICASGDTSYATNTSFLTPCVAFTAPFTDNFDASSNLSVCYNVLSYYDSYGTIYPQIATGTFHSANRSLYMYTYSTENFIVAPSVDLAGNNMHVSFWGYGYGTLIAGVVTNRNDASTFIALDTIEGSGDGMWREYEFYTDAVTADTAYVAFRLSYSSFNLDDLRIEASTDCRRPMEAFIDGADTVSVGLHWIPSGSGSSSYEVGYAPVYDYSNATVIGGINDTVFTVTGLTPNVFNHFWVRSACSEDTSHWLYVGGVRTDCSEDGMVAPYVDHFLNYTSNVPSCWNILQTYNYYGTVYPYVYSGSTSGYFVMYPQYETPNFAVAPKMRLPYNEIAVELEYYGGYSGQAMLELGYVTNPDSVSTFVPIDTVIVSGSAIHEYEFNTGAVTNITDDSLWIAFRANVSGTSQSAYVYISYLKIKHLSNCSRPSMLTLDTVGHDMAILHWDSVAENYEILYSTTNNVDNPDAVTIPVEGENSVQIDDLQPSTTYYVWVRTDCDGEYSEWRQTSPFKTFCGEEYCYVGINVYDSYYYACYYNAVNIYIDSNLYDVINYDNYASNNVNVQAAVCDGQTITLTYEPMGGYDDYVTITVTDGAGSQVFSGSCENFNLGDTVVYVTKPCPTCLPVSSLAIDAELTEANSITVHWQPNSTYAGETMDYVVTVDGIAVATTTDTFYTVLGLTAETQYVIGVATKCDDEDTAGFTYVNASTSCEGGSCNVFVYMHDSYGDGWNNAQLYIYQNGGLKGLAELASGSDGVSGVYVCQGDSLSLSWTMGNYDSEISFEIVGMGGDTLFATSYPTAGFLGMTDTVSCPSCMSPAVVNVSNITMNGADISWNTNGLADHWRVNVFNGNTLVSSTVVDGSPYQISGLSPATQYTVSVASVCGNDTAMATTTMFATTCDEITLPWYFYSLTDPSAATNTMPLCWYVPVQYSVDLYGYTYTYPQNSTYDGLTVAVIGQGTCMAATPRIPAPANNLYIRANMTVEEETYYSGTSTIQIGVMTNPSDQTTFVPIETLTSGSGQYEFITTNIAGLTSDSAHIAIRVNAVSSETYYQAGVMLQDIYVQVAPDCQRPDSVTFSNINTTTATIGWTNTGANHSLHCLQRHHQQRQCHRSCLWHHLHRRYPGHLLRLEHRALCRIHHCLRRHHAALF